MKNLNSNVNDAISLKTGSNQKKVKVHNKSLVLDYIRLYEPLARHEIAAQTGLSAQTVSNLVNELINDGLVMELSIQNSGRQARGASPTYLGVQGDSMYAVGVQVQFSRIIVALINLRGDIVKRSEVPIQKSTLEFLRDSLEKVIDGNLRSSFDMSKLIGIGIGIPNVDYHTQNPRSGLGLDHLTSGSIKSLVEGLSLKYKTKVWVENNAQAAAMGEYWMARGRVSRSFVYVYVGENLGGGLVLHGDGYFGQMGKAMEIGHIQYVPHGLPCTCGAQGCVEQYASPNAVKKALNLPLISDFHEIVKKAQRSDTGIRRALDDAAIALSTVIVNLYMVFDLSTIILGGPHAVDLFEWVHPLVSQEAEARKLALQLELSNWGIDAGAIGAASAVFHQVMQPRS